MERRVWVTVLVGILLVAALVAYGRGPDHHRGDDVGAIGAPGAPTGAVGG